MKYKIEIWRYLSVIDTYESDNIADLIKWYKTNWYYIYESGECSFIVYENGIELSFEEEYQLGFHSWRIVL